MLLRPSSLPHSQPRRVLRPRHWAPGPYGLRWPLGWSWQLMEGGVQQTKKLRLRLAGARRSGLPVLRHADPRQALLYERLRAPRMPALRGACARHPREQC
eukprot:1741521-Heterocapsa_arctica.AAC.2